MKEMIKTNDIYELEERRIVNKLLKICYLKKTKREVNFQRRHQLFGSHEVGYKWTMNTKDTKKAQMKNIT